MLSPRVAPFTIGLGLLEAITEADLLANVRTGDPDGVKGRPNHVWDGAAKRTTVGRFGWKANVPTVLDQTAGAFLGEARCDQPLHARAGSPGAPRRRRSHGLAR